MSRFSWSFSPKSNKHHIASRLLMKFNEVMEQLNKKPTCAKAERFSVAQELATLFSDQHKLPLKDLEAVFITKMNKQWLDSALFDHGRQYFYCFYNALPAEHQKILNNIEKLRNRPWFTKALLVANQEMALTHAKKEVILLSQLLQKIMPYSRPAQPNMHWDAHQNHFNPSYWYDTDDMNGIMRSEIDNHIQNNQKKIVIAFAPVPFEDRDSLLYHLTRGFQGAQSNLQLEWQQNIPEHTLLIPILIHGNHWVGCILEIKPRENKAIFRYIDPLHDNPNVEIINLLQCLITQMVENKNYAVKPASTEHPIWLQPDLCSCGPYLIANFIRYAFGEGLRDAAPSIAAVRQAHITLIGPKFREKQGAREENNASAPYRLSHEKTEEDQKNRIDKARSLHSHLVKLHNQTKADFYNFCETHKESDTTYYRDLRSCIQEMAELEMALNYERASPTAETNNLLSFLSKIFPNLTGNMDVEEILQHIAEGDLAEDLPGIFAELLKLKLNEKSQSNQSSTGESIPGGGAAASGPAMPEMPVSQANAETGAGGAGAASTTTSNAMTVKDLSETSTSAPLEFQCSSPNVLAPSQQGKRSASRNHFFGQKHPVSHTQNNAMDRLHINYLDEIGNLTQQHLMRLTLPNSDKGIEVIITFHGKRRIAIEAEDANISSIYLSLASLKFERIADHGAAADVNSAVVTAVVTKQTSLFDIMLPLFKNVIAEELTEITVTLSELSVTTKKDQSKVVLGLNALQTEKRVTPFYKSTYSLQDPTNWHPLERPSPESTLMIQNSDFLQEINQLIRELCLSANRILKNSLLHTIQDITKRFSINF